MTETLSLTADSDEARLDKLLSDRYPGLSRSRIRRLIAEGHVVLDGGLPKPSSRVRRGQLITLTIPDPAKSHMPAQRIPVNVVYQDGDLLVVDKPAGLTVHPGAGRPDGTLVNALLALCPDLQGIGGTVRPGIVHRLDKDTSGLMVVAKSQDAHARLAAQLKAREFTKRYKALVSGRPSHSEAVIEAPIGRDPGHRKRMAVVSSGREASTRYRVLKGYDGCSLLEASPTTGRTHQIRVHLASIGHPLVGDALYGKAHPVLRRHFLHAHVLGFRLPSTGEYAEFTSELPPELREFLESL